MHTKENFLTLLVYVDGILIKGVYEATTIKVKSCLHE